LCDLGDNLSRARLKLWTKHVNLKTLRVNGFKDSWGNKTEWGTLLSKIENGMRLTR